MIRNKLIFGVLILALNGGYSVTIHAELMEEITVTAQKREQSIQDVGIAVTAFSGDQIRELGFTRSTDIIAHTPGVEISGAGGGATNTFAIRGVAQNDFAAAQESPVAVYVDDSYISQNVVTGFSLFDIARVEILRGPQGTLFGRNATGGLVHYITERPSQEFGGFIEVELGEAGRHRVEAAVSGGLSDTVSGRLSAVYNKSDGLIENDIGPDLMRTDDYAVRGQLLFEPTDELSVLLKVQYGDEDGAKGGFTHQVASNGMFVSDPTTLDNGGFGVFPGYRDADGDTYTQSQDFPNFRKVEMTDLSAQINWDIGNVTLTSITDYQDIDHLYSEDSDASPNSIYEYVQADNVQQISQEIRLSWEGEKSRSVVGLYYLDIDGDHRTFQTGFAFFGPGFGFPAGFVETVLIDQQTETFSLFGQTEIDLSDTLALTLGLRYNKDKKDFNFNSTDLYQLQGPSPFVYTDSVSDDDWSGKVQLDYKPNEDWLLYASVNRGIKSGGFNTPLQPPLDLTDFPYGGEELTSYEIGFKANLNETIRLNGSVFYYDYNDYQAYSFDGFVSTLFNATAEMSGGELELIANPIEGLDILVGLSVMDTAVSDLPLALVPSGEEIDSVLSPELSINGLIRYSWEAFGGTLAMQADYSWKDDHKFNLVVTEVIEEDAFGLLNAAVSYTSDEETWYGSVFVRNLTDEDYRTYAFDTTPFFGNVDNVPGIERWVGGNIGYRF